MESNEQSHESHERIRAEPSAPSTGPDGTATALRFCKRCGHGVEPVGRGRCPKHGTTLPGNTLAVSVLHPALPAVLQRRAAIVEEWHRDLGGVEHCDAATRAIVQEIAFYTQQIEDAHASDARSPKVSDRLLDISKRREALIASLRRVSALVEKPCDPGNAAIRGDLGAMTMAELADRTAALLAEMHRALGRTPGDAPGPNRQPK